MPKYKHGCPTWDGLEIDETMYEFISCDCHYPSELKEEVRIIQIQLHKKWTNEKDIFWSEWDKKLR